MRDLNDLGYFAAVVANGGFSAASRALDAPKSRISRRVAALEDQLGVRLLERSTRSFKVTAVGHDVYRHATAALAEADAIVDAVSRLKAEPQGLVRVSAPPGIDRFLGEAMPAFLQRYPKVSVQMMVTDRRVDLIEEGVDVAIRIRERLDSDADLQVKILGHTGGMLVASPRFIAGCGAPDEPADLARFATISLTEQGGPQRWPLVGPGGELIEVVHEPRLSAGAFSIVHQAVLEGAGIAMLPDYACREAIGSGELVRILPCWTIPQRMLHLLFTSRRGLLLSVRAVIDFLAETFSPRSQAWRMAAE